MPTIAFCGEAEDEITSYRDSEEIGLLAIIVPKLELCNVRRQEFLGDRGIRVDGAALNQGEKPSIAFVLITPKCAARRKIWAEIRFEFSDCS